MLSHTDRLDFTLHNLAFHVSIMNCAAVRVVAHSATATAIFRKEAVLYEAANKTAWSATADKKREKMHFGRVIDLCLAA